MSAIHYSQMLCQLSYGEAFASCLLSLHVTASPKLKYGAFCSQEMLLFECVCLSPLLFEIFFQFFKFTTQRNASFRLLQHPTIFHHF